MLTPGGRGQINSNAGQAKFMITLLIAYCAASISASTIPPIMKDCCCLFTGLISGMFCVTICTGQLQFSLPGQPNDVAVSSTSNVYVSNNVSGSGRVYRLKGSLVQQELLQFPSGTSVLRIALSSDESRLIVCVSNKSCISYIANDCTKGSVSTFQNSLASSNNVALVSAPVIGGGNSASGFCIGSSNGTVILIGQYGLDGAAGSVSRSSGNLFGVTAGSFTRNWFGGVVAGFYTYLVVIDVSTTSSLSRPGVGIESVRQ